MLYKVITGNKNSTVLIILFIGLIIWLPAIFSNENTGFSVTVSQMPLYKLTSDLFTGQIILPKITAFVLVLMQGILIYRINIKFFLIQKKTFLPVLFYILFTGYLPQLHHLNEVLIASFFIVLILSILMNSYQAEPNSYRFFDAGIVLGFGMMFYAPLIYFLGFIWLSTTILRTFYWREYVYPMLGLLIPFIFYFTWLFFNDIEIQRFLRLFGNELYGGFPTVGMKWPGKLFTAYSIIIVLISSIHMLRVFQFRKIYIRDYFMLLFWLFILSLLIFLIFTGLNIGMIYIISIPVTFIVTNYFTATRDKWWNKSMLYVLMLGPVLLVVSESLGWF